MDNSELPRQEREIVNWPVIDEVRGSSETLLRTGITEASFWDARKTPSIIDASNNAEMNGDNSAANFWMTQIRTGSSSLDLHAT